MVEFEKASAGSEWSEVAMKAPLRKWGRGNRQAEDLRIRSRREEIFWAHSHLPKAAGRGEAGKSEPVRREPEGRGGLIRHTAIAATLLNGLLVTSVILLVAMLVPGSLPTANGGDESAGDALATPSAFQEPVAQGLAVTENRESEPQSAAEQAGIRVPAQRNQPTATETTSSWSAAMIEEVLTAIEESNESGVPARSSVAAVSGATVHPPLDIASAASVAHPGTTSSSILQKRPPADQSALPDAGFPDRPVEAPARTAEARRFGAQAQDASNTSAETGVRLIKSGAAAVVTADSTSPIDPDSLAAAAEPSGDGELTDGGDRELADGQLDALAEAGGVGAFANLDVMDEQPSDNEIRAQIEPDIATAAADVTPEVTRFAPVTANVNMRAGADFDAAVITVVSAGTEVGVIGCDSWCEVVFTGERGWIYQSFVSDGLVDGNSGGVERSDAAHIGGSGGASGDLGETGATASASADVGNSPASSEGSTGVDTTAAVQSAGELGAAANVQVAAGTPLISADGAPIGMVRNFTTDATGQTFVVVDLREELGTAVPSIRLRAEHVLTADRHARLRFTRAQLVNSLATTIGRPGDASSGLTPRAP
jgi:hypothetical protein